MERAMAAAAGLLVLAGSASAETRERTIKANTVAAVGGFLGYEVDTCYPAEIPDVKIRQAPANGSLRIVPHEEVLGKDSRCPGTKVRGLAYVYTPKKGFRGTDEATVDVPWNSTDSGRATILSYTYRIRVE
ncbi:hypothetical protein ILT44_20530 [Microvirga sp. BT689]|uniref:hypothetical protein n=1 Tax=Microvirga arvi TaxID=2778731 RepID=UPI00194E7E8C|nr:hypothetical protein [Microvirga arvi]MBM6582596.1 hypothetical protein [Microvirga arvi]